MKKLVAGLLAALLLSGCAGRTAGPESSAQPEPLPPLAPQAESGDETGTADPFQLYDDLDYCQKTILARYGNLVYIDESWTGYEEISPDTLFQFTLQVNYNLYISKQNYEAMYGPEFAPKETPRAADGRPAFPGGEVEQTALDYFGAPPEYLREAYSYDPGTQTYSLMGAGFGEEWIPKAAEVTREGNLLTLTYEVNTREFNGIDQDGKPVSTPARHVYTAVMTVELKPEGGFFYRSVEVQPGEAASDAGGT